MNYTVLLEKLIAIERAIGTAENRTMRDLVQDAQRYLLEIQREKAESTLRRIRLPHEISASGVAGFGR